MNVMILMVFVSLMLVGAGLVLFGHSMRKKDHQHADRLALLPVTDAERPVPAKPARPPPRQG